jgi:hypothetical protein
LILYRESGLVRTDEIVFREWICEMQSEHLAILSGSVADAVSSRYRGKTSREISVSDESVELVADIPIRISAFSFLNQDNENRVAPR